MCETKTKVSAWDRGGWPQLQDFSSIILALPYCSQVTLAFLLQLMKISDSSCFNQLISLWLLQFLWITLLLVTYMNLDTCSALSLLSTYPTLDTSLAWICHIHLCSASFMPCLSVFYFLHYSSVGGFSTHYLKRQSQIMVSHFSAFPKYQLSLSLLKALNLKFFTVKT